LANDLPRSNSTDRQRRKAVPCAPLSQRSCCCPALLLLWCSAGVCAHVLRYTVKAGAASPSTSPADHRCPSCMSAPMRVPARMRIPPAEAHSCSCPARQKYIASTQPLRTVSASSCGRPVLRVHHTRTTRAAANLLFSGHATRYGCLLYSCVGPELAVMLTQ
jgi:hypothetical protein